MSIYDLLLNKAIKKAHITYGIDANNSPSMMIYQMERLFTQKEKMSMFA